MWWTELALNAACLDADLGAEPDVHPEAEIAPTAVLSGPVRIGARTKVCHGAVIQGPVAIGDDCLVGNLAMIRGATRIGDGTRIGFSAEIKNALIGANVTIGPQCFVADSVVRGGAYLGAQVRTSNHRLDRRSISVMDNDQLVDTGLKKLGCLIGEGAALGIHVIILPGRIVAAGSVFEPRITIAKNHPGGRYRLSQSILKIEE